MKTVGGFLACPQCGSAGRDVVEAHQRTVRVMRYTMVGINTEKRIIEYTGGYQEKVQDDEVSIKLYCTACEHTWRPPQGWGLDNVMVVTFNDDRGLLPRVKT